MSNTNSNSSNSSYTTTPRSYDELYTEMLPRLIAYARTSYSHDIASAEDIAQEAFLRLWKHWPNKLALQSARKQHGWLYRVVARICIDLGRRRQSLQRQGAEFSSLDMALLEGNEPRDSDAYSDPERVLIGQEEWADLMRYCNAHTARARSTYDAVRLYATGYTTEDAAALTGTTASAVKMAMCRARQALAMATAETEEGMVAA